MGRQWLLSKRSVASLKKSQATGKFVKEIMVAAKFGGPDPAGNARLFAAIEKARRESVSRDVIERAIKKGAGIGEEKMVMEHIVFEGYAPHKVPVIAEVYTDNHNRTAPELRVLFKRGQLGVSGRTPLTEVLREAALVKSNGEVRRLVTEGGLVVNGEKIADFNIEVGPGDEIRVGRHRYLRLVAK